MYQIAVRENELPWADLGMPGVTMKVLHRDEATGAMAVLTRIDAGASIPAHWHSKADETVFVVEGDFVEAGVSYGPGAYFVGMARKRRQADTPGAMQLYASGCSGNVTAGKYNDGDPANRAVLADRIHAGMSAAWKATKKTAVKDVTFRSVPLTLEARTSEGFSEEALTKKLKDDPRPFGQCLAALGLSWKHRCDAGKPIDLPVLDFGGAAITLLPAESYVEFQLAAQKARPDAFVLVAGYGECGPGYIPTERAWKENDGNLSDWCWVNPGSEKRMVEAIGKVLKK